MPKRKERPSDSRTSTTTATFNWTDLTDLALLLYSFLNCQIELSISRWIHWERPPYGLDEELLIFAPNINALITHTSNLVVKLSCLFGHKWSNLFQFPWWRTNGPHWQLPWVQSFLHSKHQCLIRRIVFVGQFDHHVVLVASIETTRGWILRWRARSHDLIEWEPGCVGWNACSTKRAIRIVLKPNVNAVNVENMAAIGYDPQLLIFLKLIQANSTFTK